MNLCIILSQIFPIFWELSKKEKIIRTFSELMNQYEPRDESSKELINSYIGENH